MWKISIVDLWNAGANFLQRSWMNTCGAEKEKKRKVYRVNLVNPESSLCCIGHRVIWLSSSKHKNCFVARSQDISFLWAWCTASVCAYTWRSEWDEIMNVELRVCRSDILLGVRLIGIVRGIWEDQDSERGNAMRVNLAYCYILI